MLLCSGLKFVMDVPCEVLPLTLELMVFNYGYVAAFLLAPNRVSLFRFFDFLLVLVNMSPLLGMLSFRGQSLACYIIIALFSQVQIVFLVGPAYNSQSCVVFSLVLFDPP